MKTRDLVIVTAVTLIVGGAAGALAAGLVGSSQAAQPTRDAELSERVRHLELALEETRGRLKSAERSRDHLSEKLTGAEMRLSEVEREGPDTLAANDPAEAASAAIREVMGGLQDGRKPGRRSFRIGGRNGAVIALGDALEEFKKAATLRRLPEEERWQKAIDELRLTDGQVAELQDAVTARDEALTAASTTTEVTLDGGGTFKTNSLDHEKAEQANQAYDDRVANALDNDQREAWKDKGYEGAFGKRRRPRMSVLSRLGSDGQGGGAAVIELGVEIDTPGEQPEEK
jgi:exonuclease VII small subunit